MPISTMLYAARHEASHAVLAMQHVHFRYAAYTFWLHCMHVSANLIISAGKQ